MNPSCEQAWSLAESRRAFESMLVELTREPAEAKVHRDCARQIMALGPAVDLPAEELGEAGAAVIEALITGQLVPTDALATHAARVLCCRYGADRTAHDATSLSFEPLANDPLFLGLLVAAPIPDFDLEAYVVNLRRALLERVVGGQPLSGAERTVAVAIARQAFLGEYLFEVTAEERAAIERVTEQLCRVMAEGNVFASTDRVVITAAYQPLATVADLEWWAAGTRSRWPAEVRPLIEQQVDEPFAERRLSRRLTALTSIEQAGSKAVAQHYEQHPYPRWFRLYPRSERGAWPWGAGLPSLHPPRRILVPGCGTGRQAIELARVHPQAEIWAVDLSRASLAYAERSARRDGIANVQFFVADLLALPEVTDARFDHIDCTGVLHHLAEPRAGWAALEQMLAPGGTLRVAVYSELARMPIAFLRKQIQKLELRPVHADMQKFRRRLAEDARYRGLARNFVTSAWHCASELRDTLFHGCEHTVRLSVLKEQVDALGLELLGFRLPTAAMGRRYRERFPDDELCREWAGWLAFEREYTGTLAMFECVVRKPSG